MLLHTFLRLAMANKGLLSGTFSSTISFAEITELANTRGTPSFKITLHHKKTQVKFSIPSHRATIKFHEVGDSTVPRKKLYLSGITIGTGQESLELQWVPAEQSSYLGFMIRLYFLEPQKGNFILKIHVPYLFSVWEHQTQPAQKSKGIKRLRGF